MTQHPPDPSVLREYVATFAEHLRQQVADASAHLLPMKSPGHNYLGRDLAPETLQQIEWLLAEDPPSPAAAAWRAALDPYVEAQLRELGFWRWVAFEGYSGQDPRCFPWWQRSVMLSAFMTTGWSLAALADADVVEIGCGPLGMIEFLPARDRAAFDPLNAAYDLLFADVRSTAIRYYDDLPRLVRDRSGACDLAICFNVLDHTTQPRALFDDVMRLLRPGGRFLLQINLQEAPATPEHRRMHPSPLSEGTVRGWLDEHRATYDVQLGDSLSPDGERWFMAWGSSRTG